jgi:hypothetical protein
MKKAAMLLEEWEGTKEMRMKEYVGNEKEQSQNKKKKKKKSMGICV